MGIRGYLRAIRDFLYPPICVGCEAMEPISTLQLCMVCTQSLIETKYHLDADNALMSRLGTHPWLQQVMGYWYMNKGSVSQQLVHAVKYEGQKKLAYEIGLRYGSDLKQSALQMPDAIVPVPLHKKKLKKRGFNQSEWFGKGLAEGLGCELWPNGLVRIKNTKSQTRMNKEERLANVSKGFQINLQHSWEDKHIWLVDDVVTTGATISACAETIYKQEPSTSIGIACMAVAMDS